MRNLVVLNEDRHVLPEEASSWIDMSFDPSEGRLWCLTAFGHLVGLVDGEVVLELDLPFQENWSWCSYHAELDRIVCGSRSGHIVSVNYPDIELIGVFDDGICGMAWSPNEEQLALVTGTGKFITMNTSWDVLFETSCSSLHLSEAVQLSWRADGKYLSMQGRFTNPEKNELQIWEVDNAVWTKHGLGRYEDKKALALEGSGLSWAPNQTLIASSEHLKNQLQVVFFERNGYRHGELALGSAYSTVAHVAWNINSDVLAVATSTSTESSVQLWTRSNYHWYLKQERWFPKSIAALAWDLEKPYALHILTSCGSYTHLTCQWAVHGNTDSTIAVIDGSTLKVTHCSRAMIPPPMCAQTFEFPNAINEVAVLDDGQLVVADSRSIWRSVQNGKSTSLQVCGISQENAAELITINLSLSERASRLYSAPISSISKDGRHVQLQTKEIPTLEWFSAPCLFTEWFVIDSTTCVGVNHTKLYVNQQLIHSSIASCHYAPGYLMTTTLGSHPELHIYDVAAFHSDDVKPLHKRPVERGAKIVTSTSTEIYLQMPRGNMETISPRPLLLKLLESQMKESNYSAALEVCRKHRIDMNLLVDANPQDFLSNVNGMILSIPERIRCDRLCLFITNLHPLDVCASKYPSVISTPLSSEWNKVEEVCTALRLNLQTLDADFYLLPLITCEAKLNLLENALKRIQLLTKEQPKLAHKGLKHLVFLVEVDQLYDVALGLYDIDLTRMVAGYTDKDPKVYAPQLAGFEAFASSHSIEFMKYSIDMFLERYDQALQHLYSAGTQYYPLCLEFIREHHLYDTGLKLFKSTPSYKDLVTWFGKYLVTQKQYEEAGYTFLSIRNLPDAIDAFRKAQKWEMALNLATDVPIISIQSLAYELATELIQNNDPRPRDAAQIYIDYCKDIDEGIATLVNGQLYKDALQLALLHDRADLVETDVQPAVEQAAEDLLEEYEGKLISFKKYWMRLTTLREQIRLFRLHGIDGKAENGEAGDDTASSAASALSQSSISSVGSHNSKKDIKFGFLDAATQSAAMASSFYASSVSASNVDAPTMKKKMPRRFRRTKIQEGSAEEDAYVEKSLLETIPTREGLQEIRTLLQLLMYFGEIKTVQKIQKIVGDCLKHMEAHPPPAAVHGESKEYNVPVDISWTVLPPSL